MTLDIAALIGMGLVVFWGGIVLLLAYKPWKKTHVHWDKVNHSSHN